MSLNLAQKEVGQWSIHRACRALIDPHYNCFEKEISQSDGRLGGTGSFGEIRIPEQVQNRMITAAAAGGTIGTIVLPKSPYCYGRSILAERGAQWIYLPERTGNVVIPIGATASEGEFVGENSAPASTPVNTFGQTIATPHRQVIENKFSREYLAQTGDIEGLTERSLIDPLNARTDRAAFAGLGGKSPLGLLYKDGITTISLGDNGALPTWQKICDTVGTPIAARVPLSKPGWVISPAMRSVLMRTARFSNTSIGIGESFGGQDFVAGFPASASEILPDDLVKGSGTNLGSAIFCADWSQVIVIQWGPITLLKDPFTEARTGIVSIVAEVMVDVVAPRASAFARIKDAITT